MTVDLETVEEIELDLLLEAIGRRYGYDFRNYARASLRRRVQRVLELEDLDCLSALQARLLRDPGCIDRFISTLSVHVTSMFRDPDFYRSLREDVVPILRTYPFIRVWHAGCSSGEEVFSLAILLEEEGLYDRTRLYATDLSDTVLEQARGGTFPLARMREHTTNYLKAGGTVEFSRYYGASGDQAVFRQSLRRNMIFSQHNLVSDAPFNEFHVIMCRNVMIYFDSTLRERVHQLLYDSLLRLGVLALGKKETVDFTSVGKHYSPINANLRLYRKER